MRIFPVGGAFTPAIRPPLGAAIISTLPVTKTVDTDFDSAVQKQLSLSGSSLDGAVQKQGIQVTTGADAAVSIVKTVTGDLDSAVMAIILKTPGFDSAVRDTIIQTSSLNAAVRDTFTNVPDFDAAVWAQVLKTAGFDANITTNSIFLTTDFNAAVLKAALVTLGMNAAVIDTLIQTTGLNADVVYPAIELSNSAWINPGSQSTSARLTPPVGKTTADFESGYISDDENPSDPLDLGSSKYTELEWSIIGTSYAVHGQTYELRVTKEGNPLDSYLVTAEITLVDVLSITSSFDARLVLQSLLTAGFDSAVRGAVTVTTSLDSAVQSIGEFQTTSFDAQISIIPHEDVFFDSAIQGTLSKTIGFDLAISAQGLVQTVGFDAKIIPIDVSGIIWCTACGAPWERANDVVMHYFEPREDPKVLTSPLGIFLRGVSMVGCPRCPQELIDEAMTTGDDRVGRIEKQVGPGDSDVFQGRTKSDVDYGL